jgi:hypothetical protein
VLVAGCFGGPIEVPRPTCTSDNTILFSSGTEPPVGDSPVPCIEDLVGDVNQPDCVATDVIYSADGTRPVRLLPRCGPSSAGDCWEFVRSAICALLGRGDFMVRVVRASSHAPAAETTLECSRPCE